MYAGYITGIWGCYKCIEDGTTVERNVTYV